MHNTKLLFIIASLFILPLTAAAQEISSQRYYSMAKAEGSTRQNFTRAAQYSEKALALSPKNMDVKEYLGKCYMEVGKLDTARTTLLEYYPCTNYSYGYRPCGRYVYSNSDRCKRLYRYPGVHYY